MGGSVWRSLAEVEAGPGLCSEVCGARLEVRRVLRTPASAWSPQSTGPSLGPPVSVLATAFSWESRSGPGARGPPRRPARPQQRPSAPPASPDPRPPPHAGHRLGGRKRDGRPGPGTQQPGAGRARGAGRRRRGSSSRGAFAFKVSGISRRALLGPLSPALRPRGFVPGRRPADSPVAAPRDLLAPVGRRVATAAASGRGEPGARRGRGSQPPTRRVDPARAGGGARRGAGPWRC